MALNINPNSAGSGALSATGDIASAAKGTTSATKGASASNNILSLLNSDDDASSNKSTGNFSGGDSTTSLRDQIKNANKSIGNQTVDDTFKIGSGESKYNDDTVFVGAGGQTATLGEIKSGVKNLSVDDVWSTGNNTGSNPNTPYNTDNTVQGDYQASKNESSKIETGTFGKQDEIVTNPNLVVQDKGLVKNDSIDSVGGLVTEQKDKESQDVLDSKKKRDEAEADDASKKMRDRIRSVNDDTVIDDEARDFFKIGNEAGADENVFTPADYAFEDDETGKATVKGKETEPVEMTDLSEDADYFRGQYKLTKDPSYLKAAEALDAVNAQKKALEEQTAKIAGKDFNELSDADIAAWVEAQKKYTDNLMMH